MLYRKLSVIELKLTLTSKKKDKLEQTSSENHMKLSVVTRYIKYILYAKLASGTWS